MSISINLSEHERKSLEKRLADLAALLDGLSYRYLPPHARREEANELHTEMTEILGMLVDDLVHHKESDSIKAGLDRMRQNLATHE